MDVYMKLHLKCLFAVALIAISLPTPSKTLIELQVDADSDSIELLVNNVVLNHLEKNDNYQLVTSSIESRIKIHFVIVSIKENDKLIALSISTLATMIKSNEGVFPIEFHGDAIDINNLKATIKKYLNKILV
jgi:hypothetical protein